VEDLRASNGGGEGRVFVRRICHSIPAAAAGGQSSNEVTEVKTSRPSPLMAFAGDSTKSNDVKESH